MQWMYSNARITYLMQGLLHKTGRSVVSFDPTGTCFAVASATNTIKLYDIRSFDKVRVLVNEASNILTYYLRLPSQRFTWVVLQFIGETSTLVPMANTCYYQHQKGLFTFLMHLKETSCKNIQLLTMNISLLRLHLVQTTNLYCLVRISKQYSSEL